MLASGSHDAGQPLLFPVSVEIAGLHRIIVSMVNAVQFASVAPRRFGGLVCLLWQTAPFVFLAASASTGIVPLWFHVVKISRCLQDFYPSKHVVSTFFWDLQASVWRTWPMLFLCKDSEIAPRRLALWNCSPVFHRARDRGEKSFRVKKYSELCELRDSVVNTLSQ